MLHTSLHLGVNAISVERNQVPMAMAQPDNHKVRLVGDELVFAIVRQAAAPARAASWIPPGTRLDVTLKH